MSRINGTQNIVFPYTLLTHHSMVCPYTSVGHEMSCFKTSKLIKMLLGCGGQTWACSDLPKVDILNCIR